MESTVKIFISKSYPRRQGNWESVFQYNLSTLEGYKSCSVIRVYLFLLSPLDIHIPINIYINRIIVDLYRDGQGIPRITQGYIQIALWTKKYPKVNYSLRYRIGYVLKGGKVGYAENSTNYKYAKKPPL